MKQRTQKGPLVPCRSADTVRSAKYPEQIEWVTGWRLINSLACGKKVKSTGLSSRLGAGDNLRSLRDVRASE